MQNIEPHAMAYFTQTGTTDDGHKQFAFHGCSLFDEGETGSIKSAVSVLDRYFTNLDRLDGVKDAYQEFKDELKKLDSRNPRSKPTVDRRFRAFILEWKLFLDHYDRYISDGAQTGYWKGVSEAEKEQYLAAFRHYFDDVKDPQQQSDAFNLAAVIRNHVQRKRQTMRLS